MNQTEQKPSLVIMAAGMGSRFGGLKQITPVGPSGEMIIDYSIYDALAAGFSRIVFVIKKEIEEMFREHIGDRIARHADVAYVYQELSALPEGFTVPEGRVKPWGTGHAVLCCRETVTGPFAVINADDYYGRDCFSLLYRFLRNRDRIGTDCAGQTYPDELVRFQHAFRIVQTEPHADDEFFPAGQFVQRSDQQFSFGFIFQIPVNGIFFSPEYI